MKKVFFLSVLFLLSSCVSYERCVQKYGRQPSDSIMVPYAVEIPGDSISVVLQFDTIPFLLPGDTVIIRDTASRASIRYWRNKYEDSIGIQADCDSIVIMDTIFIKPPPVLDPPPPSKLRKAWKGYSAAAGIAIPILVLTILLFIKLKR